jgi:hypothetical protein
MSIATTTTWKAAPGEREGLLRLFAEWKAMHERHGGRVRMWSYGLSGSDFGNLVYMVEFDDLEAYARFAAGVREDPDWPRLAPGLFSGAHGTIIHTAMLHELRLE